MIKSTFKFNLNIPIFIINQMDPKVNANFSDYPDYSYTADFKNNQNYSGKGRNQDNCEVDTLNNAEKQQNQPRTMINNNYYGSVTVNKIIIVESNQHEY